MEVPGITDLGKQAYGASHVHKNVTRYVKEQFVQGSGERERETNRRKRLEQARHISDNFYTLVTDFYEYGYGQSFHFATVMDGATMSEDIAEYEKAVARTLKAGPGMKLLDVGCGVGGPMLEIVKFSGSHAVGLNSCDYQLKRANYHTEKAKMQDLCSYVKGDFLNMDFEDNTFDGAYCLEASCHAKDPVKLYAEICRVLKPGAIFVDSAWAMTDKFDPQNSDHVRIKDDVEIGNAVADLRTEGVLLDAVRRAGLEVVEFKNAHYEGDLPWYTFLSGKNYCSFQSFRASSVGRMATHFMLSAMEPLHLVPHGSKAVHSVLLTAADSLIEAGKRDILTPIFRIVCRKPL